MHTNRRTERLSVRSQRCGGVGKDLRDAWGLSSCLQRVLGSGSSEGRDRSEGKGGESGDGLEQHGETVVN